MKNKLRANDSYMPIKFFKMLYIQSFMAGNALVQISTRIGKHATKPFTNFKKMLEVLTAGFDNLNEKKKAKAAYKLLRQGTRKFNLCWTKF